MNQAHGFNAFLSWRLSCLSLTTEGHACIRTQNTNKLCVIRGSNYILLRNISIQLPMGESIDLFIIYVYLSSWLLLSDLISLINWKNDPRFHKAMCANTWWLWNLWESMLVTILVAIVAAKRSPRVLTSSRGPWPSRERLDSYRCAKQLKKKHRIGRFRSWQWQSLILLLLATHVSG